ncbi:hypothetical protein [Janthinobacterium sp.]|uniref:hypothetical protein n=1 Tax=Janthinobacterium sp. TaxID=1871054 RepID=UPI00293D44EC|nr:hypothetical protein [Janthinobacterium sp.]
MNEDMVIVGVVLLFLLSRKKTAGMAPMNPATLNAANMRNVQSDMWSRLLGQTWTKMLDSAVTSGTIATNSAGQAVSGTGVPVSSGNPTADTTGYNDSGSYYGNYSSDPALIGGTDMAGNSDVYEGAVLA